MDLDLDQTQPETAAEICYCLNHFVKCFCKTDVLKLLRSLCTVNTIFKNFLFFLKNVLNQWSRHFFVYFINLFYESILIIISFAFDVNYLQSFLTYQHEIAASFCAS